MTQTKLLQKFLAVQKQLKPLPKSGKNDFHKYSYTTAVDALDPIREACNAQGLAIFASVTDSTSEPGRAWVTVCLTLADPESGESITIQAPGYAEDWSYKENRPSGDKAIYKAITGATKYAFRELFCLPSEDDPETTPRLSSSRSHSSPNSPNSIKRTNNELTREEYLAKFGRPH